MKPGHFGKTHREMLVWFRFGMLRFRFRRGSDLVPLRFTFTFDSKAHAKPKVNEEDAKQKTCQNTMKPEHFGYEP